MSYIFFEDILKELGYKFMYEGVVNLAGNAFAKDSWTIIHDHNPMSVKDGADKKNNDIAQFFGGANVKYIDSRQWSEGEGKKYGSYKNSDG